MRTNPSFTRVARPVRRIAFLAAFALAAALGGISGARADVTASARWLASPDASAMLANLVAAIDFESPKSIACVANGLGVETACSFMVNDAQDGGSLATVTYSFYRYPVIFDTLDQVTKRAINLHANVVLEHSNPSISVSGSGTAPKMVHGTCYLERGAQPGRVGCAFVIDARAVLTVVTQPRHASEAIGADSAGVDRAETLANLALVLLNSASVGTATPVAPTAAPAASVAALATTPRGATQGIGPELGYDLGPAMPEVDRDFAQLVEAVDATHLASAVGFVDWKPVSASGATVLSGSAIFATDTQVTVTAGKDTDPASPAAMISVQFTSDPIATQDPLARLDQVAIGDPDRLGHGTPLLGSARSGTPGRFSYRLTLGSVRSGLNGHALATPVALELSFTRASGAHVIIRLPFDGRSQQAFDVLS